MVRFLLFCVMGALVLLFASSCSWKEMRQASKLHKEANKYFDSEVKESTKLKSALGLVSIHTYGQDRIFNLINTMKIQKNKGTGNFDITMPVWCNGKDAQGKTKKWRAVIAMTGSGEGVLQHESWSVTKNIPLTFTRQFVTWIGWTALAAIWLLWGMSRPVCTTIMMIMLPLNGYFAHVCFGSGLAIGICVASWIPLLLVSMGAFSDNSEDSASRNMLLVFVWGLFALLAGLILWIIQYVGTGTVAWLHWLGGHF